VSAAATGTARPARAWILGARPATLPAAAVPVLVGAAAAVSEGASFHSLIFAATMAAALFIQIGTNLANDYSDFQRGADHDGRLGPTRITQSGLLPPEAVRRGIVIAFGLAAAIGLYLAWIGGWTIVVIGLLSIACGIAYTGGPWPLGYHGLGDVFVFIFFGVIAVSGTAFLQMGTWSALALIVSIPIGLLVTNILVVNNLRDLETDRAAGKNTLAVRLGDRRTRLQYSLLVAISYFVPAALALSSPSRRWLLLPWLSAPLAVMLSRRILGGAAGRDLNPMLERSGQLLLSFGVLLSIGLLFSSSP
jgi:1,4-dihydroxy-2-naphthoate octaprenyltransferase